jgi:small multidrug resistance pump
MSSHLLAWAVLAASVVSEVAGTVALKRSQGFTRLAPAAMAGTCYVLAVWLMAVAMRQLAMGITYAVWAACGTAATALIGVAFYSERLSAVQLLGLAFIVAGVVLLSLQPRA